MRIDTSVIRELQLGRRPPRPTAAVATACQIEDELWELIDSCLCHTPDKRPQISAILSIVVGKPSAGNLISQLSVVIPRPLENSRRPLGPQHVGTHPHTKYSNPTAPQIAGLVSAPFLIPRSECCEGECQCLSGQCSCAASCHGNCRISPHVHV